MCKKYPLIAMLLVGSASYSAVVSAASYTATMRFEGTVVPVCSGRVVSSGGGKKVLFSSMRLDKDEHVHELELSSNASVNTVTLQVTKFAPLRFHKGNAEYTPEVYLKKNDEQYMKQQSQSQSQSNLNDGDKLYIYLGADGYDEAKFALGNYSYDVIATINCI
ncbi:hypothetical protein AB7D55_002933 [Vibrio mimicus]